MKEENLKKLSIEVSLDCWKKLKILSIQNETSLQEVVRNILEKSVSKKQVKEINTKEN